MKTVTIAFTGTHGTGKTTSVYELAAHIKKIPGLPNVGIVMETARLCPYPINRDTSEVAQEWMLLNQILSEHSAKKYNPIVVSDRTAMDAMVYTKVAGLDDLYYRLLPMVQHHMASYDLVIIKPAGGNEFHTDDGFRDQNAEFRTLIDKAMFDILNRDFSYSLKRQPLIMRGTNAISVEQCFESASEICRFNFGEKL